MFGGLAGAGGQTASQLGQADSRYPQGCGNQFGQSFDLAFPQPDAYLTHSPVLVRAGDFATHAQTRAYENSCFSGLTHRALTSLQRAAKPIAANCVPSGRRPFAET
jgi:hypothetical protein